MAASGTLGSLSVDLLLETLQWAAGLNKAEYQAEQFADAIEKKFNKMLGNVGDMLKGVAAGMVAGFAVDRLVSFGNEVQKTADRLDELAQKTGSTVNFMAQMSVRAEMGGVSMEAMASSFAKFNKAASEAFADDKSKPAKILADLGVAVKDSSGYMRDAEAIYKDAAKALGGIADSAQKTTDMQTLFGKSGADMIAVFNAMAREGADASAVLDNYGKQMDALAPMANAFNDAMTLLQTTSKTFMAMVVAQFLPYFTVIIKQFTDLTTGASGLSEGMTFVVNAVKGVIIVIDAAIVVITDLIKGVWAAAQAFQKFLSGDWKGAKNTIFDFFMEAGDRADRFHDRLKALTGTAEETAKGVDNLGQSVKKLPPFKLEGIEKLQKFKVDLDGLNAKIKEGIRLTKEFEDQQKLWDKFRSYSLAVEEQTRTLGLSRRELEQYRAQQELLNAAVALGIDDTPKYAEELARLNKAFADKNAREDYLEFLNTIEGEWRKAFDAMFSDTEGGWEGMLKSLKQSFKKLLLNYIYEAFAKPFLMQITAQGGGGGGMSGTDNIISQLMGGGGGGGFSMDNIVGTAYDYWNRMSGTAGVDYPSAAAELAMNAGGTGSAWTSNTMGGLGTMGAGIAGGLIGGWGAGALGAGDKGVAAGQNYGATLAAIGMQIYGPIGAAIGAVLGVVIGKATDPDPDAMRRAKFGPSAGAEGLTSWAGTSAFGSFGFSEGEWLSGEQMGESMNAFIKSIEQMDNAFAKFMTPEQIASVKKRLEEVSKTYELGMEHLDVTGLGDVLKDRLSLITHEISAGLGAFVDGFQGPIDQMVAVIDSYLAATAGVDFDPQALIDAMQPKALMESYQENSAALATYVEGLTASSDSMTGLVSGMQNFQVATVQMIVVIDQAAASMHAMFQTTADSIRQSLMTEEERYKFLQDRADALFADLLTETDPAKINDLATRINADVNAAWGMLDDTQKQTLGEDYLARLEMLDTTVADKMQALRDVVIEDSKTMMENIGAKLEELFAVAAVTAQTDAAAADTMLTAAQIMAQGVPVYMADPAAVTGG